MLPLKPKLYVYCFKNHSIDTAIEKDEVMNREKSDLEKKRENEMKNQKKKHNFVYQLIYEFNGHARKRREKNV